jgi:molybdate transport system substrate-binding protein
MSRHAEERWIMTRLVSPTVCLSLALLLADAATAGAAEITVLSSTALKTVVDVLVPQFEKATGNKVAVSYDPSNLVMEQIKAGKTFDVVIVTPPLIADLVKQGKVVDGSAVALARAGVGLAVKQGAPKPDIGTVEAVKRTLLDAKAVAYTSAGQSGLHFASVIEKLGIAEQVKAKARTQPGGAVAEFIVKGQADVAVQLIPELMSVAGVDVVGPFPPEIQTYVVLTAGIAGTSANKAVAQALIRYLSAPAAAATIKLKGMEPG